MALIVQVPGLATIKVGEALSILGYTRNGVEITHDASWLDVPGDENGGDDGPPIDVQFLGMIDRVRMELTKWDQTVADLIRARLNGATAGTAAVAGTLMFGNAKTFALQIAVAGLALPFDYPRAFPRMPIEENRGTKFATLVIEWECHQDAARKVYDQVVA